MSVNNRNKSSKCSSCVKQGGIVKCKDFCDEKIYVDNPDVPHYCAIHSKSATWISPGNVVPAKCYTTCANCNCHFKVKFAYHGKAPFCPICRPLKDEISSNLKKCETCDTYKTHVTYGLHPYRYEILGDESMFHMCEVCREESAKDI